MLEPYNKQLSAKTLLAAR